MAPVRKCHIECKNKYVFFDRSLFPLSKNMNANRPKGRILISGGVK